MNCIALILNLLHKLHCYVSLYIGYNKSGYYIFAIDVSPSICGLWPASISGILYKHSQYNTVFVFTVVDCGAPPVVAASTSSPESPATTEGSSVNYTCITGYEFSDGSTSQLVTCQSNSSWDQISACKGKYLLHILTTEFKLQLDLC